MVLSDGIRGILMDAVKSVTSRDAQVFSGSVRKGFGKLLTAPFCLLNLIIVLLWLYLIRDGPTY